MKLVKQSQDRHKNAMGYSTKGYLELVDWAGRTIRENKRVSIPSHIAPILERLNLKSDAYLNYVGRNVVPFTKRQHLPKALGSITKLIELAEKLEQKFIRGIGEARKLYQIPS